MQSTLGHAILVVVSSGADHGRFPSITSSRLLPTPQPDDTIRDYIIAEAAQSDIYNLRVTARPPLRSIRDAVMAVKDGVS